MSSSSESSGKDSNSEQSDNEDAKSDGQNVGDGSEPNEKEKEVNDDKDEEGEEEEENEEEENEEEEAGSDDNSAQHKPHESDGEEVGGSDVDDGEEQDDEEDMLSDEDEEDTLAEKLAKCHAHGSSRSMGRLDFLSFARMPFGDNQSLVLNAGNARKPDPSGNRHRGIGDALIAGGDQSQQVAYQTAVVSVQLAIRPDTELGDKFEGIGCRREVLTTGESVRNNSDEDAARRLERVEGKEEWILGPVQKQLLCAVTAVLAGQYGLAENLVKQAKAEDKELTRESLMMSKKDMDDYFTVMIQSADFTPSNWMDRKEEWLSEEELAAIDIKQATEELTDDEVNSLTMAMILARHHHMSTKVINKMVSDFYGTPVNDSLCTVKLLVSSCNAEERRVVDRLRARNYYVSHLAWESLCID